jgi:F420H(2)-dependent quinone reductase
VAVTSPTRRRALRLGARVGGGIHRDLYRLSGGRIGGRIGKLPILLLTTTGRRTGRQRTTPLGFERDGANLVVIASNGGMDWPPAWWLNLEQTPEASVELGRERLAVRSRQATGDERARLWAAITARFPAYGRYERKTTRPIPVVILEPLSSADDG